jgi:hypothetical protein
MYKKAELERGNEVLLATRLLMDLQSIGASNIRSPRIHHQPQQHGVSTALFRGAHRLEVRRFLVMRTSCLTSRTYTVNAASHLGGTLLLWLSPHDPF